MLGDAVTAQEDRTKPSSNRTELPWRDVRVGDKVADSSGDFWTVVRISGTGIGMRRVRYAESSADWNYWRNEVRTVIRNGV